MGACLTLSYRVRSMEDPSIKEVYAVGDISPQDVQVVAVEERVGGEGWGHVAGSSNRIY